MEQLLSVPANYLTLLPYGSSPTYPAIPLLLPTCLRHTQPYPFSSPVPSLGSPAITRPMIPATELVGTKMKREDCARKSKLTERTNRDRHGSKHGGGSGGRGQVVGGAGMHRGRKDGLGGGMPQSRQGRGENQRDGDGRCPSLVAGAAIPIGASGGGGGGGRGCGGVAAVVVGSSGRGGVPRGRDNRRGERLGRREILAPVPRRKNRHSSWIFFAAPIASWLE